MKKTKKQYKHPILRSIFRFIIIIGIIALLLLTTVNIWMIASTSDRIMSDGEFSFSDADCIIILGAGVRDDGSPSHMLEDRLLTGIDLYDKGYSDTVLMSGDHGRVEYDEVNTMKAFAIGDGVPVDRIFMDHAGFSTYDSI